MQCVIVFFCLLASRLCTEVFVYYIPRLLFVHESRMSSTVWRQNLSTNSRGAGEMSLLQTGPIIFGSTEGIIAFLRHHSLLGSSKTCTRQVHSENTLHAPYKILRL